MSRDKRRTAHFRRLRLAVLREERACWLCGEEIDLTLTDPRDPRYGTVDHVVPFSAGGNDRRSNLRAAHRQCNLRRQARPAHEVAPLRTSREW